MKKYYDSLSKEKKTKIKDIYNNEYKDTDLNKRLNRLLLFSIISIIASILIFIISILYEENKTGSIIISITLFILGIVYFVGRTMVKRKLLNKIALKNK